MPVAYLNTGLEWTDWGKAEGVRGSAASEARRKTESYSRSQYFKI